MFGLQYFGFSALWSPLFFIFIAAVAALYLAVVGPYRHRFANAEPVSGNKKMSFLLGLLLIYIAQGSPVDLLGHLMFSAHMISMSLAFLIAPPLILRGLPHWLVQPFIQRMQSSKLRTLLHPIVTLLAFNMLFSLYHMPAIHDYIMTSYLSHTAYYIILYVTAFMMWWPIMGAVTANRQLSEVKKMGYVFAMGALLTPACALIIFAGVPVYGIYSDPQAWAQALGYCVPGSSAASFLEQFGGPDFFALMPAIHDQQLGGVIMKLVQEFAYGAILFGIFRKWYSRENRKDNESVDELDFSASSGGLNRA